ncbi:hypothetical protein OROGR_024738 [Orobanche gracilis]
MISRQIQTLLQLSKTSIETLQLLHCLFLKTSLDHHEYFFTHLVVSAASNSIRHARKLFDYSPIVPPPLFAWNTLIKAYSNNSYSPIESVKLYVELLRTSGELGPDKFTYPFVVKACRRCSVLGVGRSVHSMVLKGGFASDPHVNNSLLAMYGGFGLVAFARRVFDEMCARDVVSWSSLIAAYIDCDTRRRRRRGESIIITLITINNFNFNSFVGIDETIKGVGRHTNNGITGKQVIIFKPRRLLWKDGIFFLSYPFIVRINFINDNGINFISPLNASLP